MSKKADDHDLVFVKSKKSQANCNCVEVAVTAGPVYVRDSKSPNGPVLILAPEVWVAFINDVRGGRWSSFQ